MGSWWFPPQMEHTLPPPLTSTPSRTPTRSLGKECPPEGVFLKSRRRWERFCYPPLIFPRPLGGGEIGVRFYLGFASWLFTKQGPRG